MFELEKEVLGAGDVDQWLRALAVLTEGPGLIPNIHTGA